ncbi:unnamed protein product [Mytilus coruscus]|uniref:Uncharacterized protein n=1 Tax=Mytilus coruscus TaxID=42192 RepID=A0A6J8CES6_MYTCO|nr:unnamed protein product [Mytilus coruscus]
MHTIHQELQETKIRVHNQHKSQSEIETLEPPSDPHIQDIERITPSVENKKEGDIIISIALWEFILIIIILLISLFILCEFLHKYRKRRRRVLTNPLNDTEIETHTIRRGHQEDEERIESVYNEIDESAMNTLIPRNILRHSYFEITNSLSSTMHTKVSSIPNSLCLSRLSLQSLLLRQTSLRVQRNNEEEINNDLHIVVGSEYSDGYLRPMSIAQLQSMDIMIEHQGTALPNNENVLRIQNDEYFYMECCSAGTGSSMSYNTLKLKGVKNQTKGICVVDNPIYNETMHRHPKYATWSSKRKTI